MDEPCPELGIGKAATSGWRRLTVACGMGQVQFCQPKAHNNVKECIQQTQSASTETQEVPCPSSLFIRLKILIKTGSGSGLKMAGK